MGEPPQRKHQRLLREHLPKDENLSRVSQQQPDTIAFQLNRQTQKSLGLKAPAELFLPEDSLNFVQFWSGTLNHVALSIQKPTCLFLTRQTPSLAGDSKTQSYLPYDLRASTSEWEKHV